MLPGRPDRWLSFFLLAQWAWFYRAWLSSTPHRTRHWNSRSQEDETNHLVSHRQTIARQQLFRLSLFLPRLTQTGTPAWCHFPRSPEQNRLERRICNGSDLTALTGMQLLHPRLTTGEGVLLYWLSPLMQCGHRHKVWFVHLIIYLPLPVQIVPQLYWTGPSTRLLQQLELRPAQLFSEQTANRHQREHSQLHNSTSHKGSCSVAPHFCEVEWYIELIVPVLLLPY